MNKKEEPNYYAIIPAEIRYDERLKAFERILYGEITALSNKNGYCYASNSYFAKLYKVTNTTISNWISNLKKYGHISVEIIYIENTKQIKERRIYLLNNSLTPIKENFNTPIKEIINTPIKEIFKDNNTSNNNTSNNNKKTNKKESKNRYGECENVYLTQKEYDFLIIEYSEKVALDIIDQLSLYIKSKGDKYKDHNATLRNWLNRKGVKKCREIKNKSYYNSME